MTSNKKREILQELLIPVIAVVLSLLIGGIIIALSASTRSTPTVR